MSFAHERTLLGDVYSDIVIYEASQLPSALLAHIKAHDEQLEILKEAQVCRCNIRSVPALIDRPCATECDVYRARAEALERAISQDCKLCKHYSDSVAISKNCAACVATRDLGRSNWEFDFERFS